MALEGIDCGIGHFSLAKQGRTGFTFNSTEGLCLMVKMNGNKFSMLYKQV